VVQVVLVVQVQEIRLANEAGVGLGEEEVLIFIIIQQ
jgi:hypothetical protein